MVHLLLAVTLAAAKPRVPPPTDVPRAPAQMPALTMPPPPVMKPAAPPSNSTKVKLVVTELTAAGGVPPEVAGALTEAVTTEISGRGFFDVMSSKDIQTILGAERQRTVLGCSEDSTSCLTELAGAMGARFVLNGSVAKLGEAYQLSLQTLDTKKAQPIGRATRIANDLSMLRSQLPYAVAEATATPLPLPPSRALPYTLLTAGGIAFLAGGLATFDSITREASVARELGEGASNPSALDSLPQYQAEASSIAVERALGLGIMAGGAILAGLGLWIMPTDASRGSGVALLPTARGVAVVGVWP